MNRKIAPAFLCLFLCLSFAGVAFAQTPSVGVSVGDKFTYNCILQGTHNTSLSWEPWTLERNQSIWEVTITDINSTKITYELKIFLSNGTEETFPALFVDLYSGGSNGPNYVYFTYANLNAGNQIYPGGPSYTVNDTSTRTYASGQRATNHVNFASALDFRDAYLDKTTGAMVELTYTYLDLAATFKLELIYSSLWLVSTSPTSPPPTTPPPTSTQTSPPVPELPAITALSIIALSGLCAAALHKKQTSARKNAVR